MVEPVALFMSLLALGASSFYIGFYFGRGNPATAKRSQLDAAERLGALTMLDIVADILSVNRRPRPRALLRRVRAEYDRIFSK